MKKIIIQGFKREELPDAEMKIVNESKLSLKQSYVFNSSRSISEKHTLEFDDTDFLEFVFEDKTTWMGSSDIIHDLFPKAAKQTRAAGDAFEIPMYLESDSATRGLFGDIALKILNVFTKKTVAVKVIDIAAKLEKKALENKSGVYAVDADFNLVKSPVTETTKPLLLFIHGTNSSTFGSFAEIKNAELWKFMQAGYGQNIFGLQHETLTKSPVQNVIDLVKELPDTCTLHIITHSRGGLVGDVLARFCNDNNGFTDLEIEYLQKEKRTADIANLKTLKNLAAKKKITIDKFIRVACPAYGTTILSKRLDHFLNISFNLLGTLFGPVGTAVVAEFKNLIAAAVDTKNDPNDLPGLEAMNPSSAFLKVLNNPGHNISGPLAVISGNCGIKFNLKALLVIASKLFYLRDNDLVVDTRSMYCGSKRTIPIQYFFDEGPEVDHVHYFKNKKTQDALLLALKTTTISIPGFTSYEQSVTAALTRNAVLGLEGGDVFYDKVSGKKPIVILLPGIMGSNLEQNGKKIWINYIRFLVGELSRLDIAKEKVTAKSLIKTSYKKLAEYLQDEYDVVTFPFDWRLPLGDAAALLKNSIEKYLKLKVPIKIVGHSMGGVVTRDFIINHPATWKKLNESKGFKLLFLGAPLGGSYRIPYVLAGKDSIINQLSKIDLKHTKKELLDMFRKYPGLLGLLPTAKQPHDFALLSTWQEMRANSLFDWNIPDQADLDFFGAYRDKILQNMELIDMENIIYIAGKDDATVCGYEINKNLPDEKIVFKSTTEGDQSVTWETGIPEKIDRDNSLYYVDVSHGGLANDPDIFNGIAEILRIGKTESLPKTKPLSRAVTGEFDTVEEEVYDSNEAGLEQSLMGIKAKPAIEKKGKVPLKVSVSNGDLFYSRYPVLVGHFSTDGITSAEYIIDKYTGNVLREWHRLNLYPGPIGTSEVFVNFNNEFKGAVVIGLGAPGRLSAHQLAKTTEQGAVKYMLELKKIKKNISSSESETVVGLSVLLIGCGYGGLSIDSSIRSIIQGIQNANIKIEAMALEGLHIIEQVEFVELYEDRCLQCLYTLSKLEAEEDVSINIRLLKKQYKVLLGSRTRIPLEMGSDWWSRISIVLHKEDNSARKLTETALRFSCSTGGAREEQRDLQSNPQIINRLIEEMSTKNNWNGGLAKAVFELLIPNDFKDEIKKQTNTMWVLDSAAAAYPWELLQDSANNARPICCNTGMIRQLQTENYRLKINASTGNNALVVGDPDLNGYPKAQQLPHAFHEANKVAALLGSFGYDMPNNCIKKSAVQIIEALYKEEYRIMHLAGHGIFNEQNPDLSGMLIGNNVFLSTKEIGQMSTVPDLVFVNCCFLGKVDDQAEELYSSRYKLAANIGTQLIMNGVKVVIAAGWAVDDKAAMDFTDTFYSHLLSGSNFGDAIKKARSRTYMMHPDNNTWGAYQCYGDPFFKLSKTAKAANVVLATSKSAAAAKTYLIAEEAEIDLANLINKADTKAYPVKYLEADLAEIIKAVDVAAIRNAVITEKEAMAYVECSNYKKAIEKFERLLTMEDAAFSVNALEKYCNIRAKFCVKNWQSGVDKSRQLSNLKKVITDLNQLIKISPTAKRLGLLGGTYKRMALMAKDNKSKIAALVKAAAYYQQSEALPQNGNITYALTNWLEIENILVQLKKRKWGTSIPRKYKLPTLQAAMEQMAAIVKANPAVQTDMNYWDEVNTANARLCQWLLEGGKSKTLTSNIVIDSYMQVWAVAGSQNKKVAEIEHFDFLIDVYSSLLKSPSIVKKIKTLKNKLNDFLIDV
ncbi:MAG: CHAT domain-containing protein [Ferruginibacter sp.]